MALSVAIGDKMKGLATQVADNAYQRWGAGNPGTNPLERAGARALDRRADAAQGTVDTWGTDTVIGGAAQNRLDRISGTYEDKFGAGVNSAAAPASDGAPLLEGVGSAVKGAADYAFKPGSTTGEVMADSAGALKDAQAGNSLSNTVDDQLEKAMKGELTDAGSEWYQNKSAQLDANAEDAGKKMTDALSWSGNTGSGIEGRAVMDMQRKLAGDKAMALAEAQDKYSLAGINRAGQKEANAVNIGQLAVSQDSNDAQADLGYKGNARGWVGTAADIWNTAAANRRARLSSLPNRYTPNMMNYANSLA